MGAVLKLRGRCRVMGCIHVARAARGLRFGRSARRASGPLASGVRALVAHSAPTDDGLGTPGALLPFSTFTPLHLSLTQGLFPIESRFPGCASREDASGNSINGFAVERYSYLRLTPQLTLHGFSSAGCAIDAGLGGGLTYSTPLANKWWLASSVGFYTLPPADSSMSAVVSTSARVDVVKQLPAGHVLNFGLGTRNRGGAGLFNAVSFGGNF